MNSILLNEKWYWKTIGVLFRYRFIEKESGLFFKDYTENFRTTINIENCSIDYRKNSFTQYKIPTHIINHKDIVILYCIDRLLTKGYKRDDIAIISNAKYQGLPDIIIKDRSGTPYLAIFCYKWGKKYKKVLMDFRKKKSEIFKYYRNHKKTQYLCIFSSYLDGGLPYITYAFYDMKKYEIERPLYHLGIFEKEINPYKIIPHYTEKDKNMEIQRINKDLSVFPDIVDYVIKNGEIVEYKGKNQVIILPNQIKSIGIGAFWDNNFLKSIKLNEGITRIGGDAFYKCEILENVNIPSTVYEIGNNPFAGCSNLFLENDSNYFVLEDGVLYNKKKTKILHYPTNRKSKFFEIPNTVQYINKHAFYNNKFLKTLIIPESVKWIENNLLSGCRIEKIINKSPHFCVNKGVLYNKDKSQVFSVFNHKLKELILPNSVKKIGKNSFFGCSSLKSLYLSKHLIHIGYNPFVGCSNLKIINESSKFIMKNGILIDKKQNLIKYCPNTSIHESIEIPSFINIIGRNSFSFCYNLKKIKIPESVNLIERGAFANCENLEKVEIPNSVEKIEKWVFSHCQNLREIRIPKHTELAEYIFLESPTQVFRY